MLIENARLSKLKPTFSLEDVVFRECELRDAHRARDLGA
jgi:hypothetical protein